MFACKDRALGASVQTVFRAAAMSAICFFAVVAFAPAGQDEKNALEKRVDAYLARYAAAQDFSGVMLIARGDEIVFRKAYGFADPTRKIPNQATTAFRVASLSKTFTAAAVSMLIEREKVGLLDPLSHYIPDFPNGDKILIRHLLLHTSGVGAIDSEDAIKNCLGTMELVKRIAAAPPQFPPGTNDSYSNEGYVLLAAVIEKVSGKSYENFLTENIFKPLGMNHSGAMCTDWPVKNHACGSFAGFRDSVAPIPFEEAGWNGPGSLYSTVDDLLLWLKAEDSDKLFAFSKLEYPFGWGRRNYSGKALVEQTGQLEGYTAHMALYPQEHLYLVFLSNAQSGMTSRMPKDFEALMSGAEPSTPPQAKEADDLHCDLHQFEGAFATTSIPVPLRFEVKDNRLWSSWGNSPFLHPLIATNADSFFCRSDYTTLNFKRDGAGEVDKVACDFGDSNTVIFDRNEPAPPR